MMNIVFFIFEGFSLILVGKILVYAGECTESKATVEVVPTCPHTSEKWEERSTRKNCTSFNHSCSSFEYHCVMNTWGNETVEVCAPSVKIIGNVCAEYNTGGLRIQRNGKMRCSSCPAMYDSTESYKYRKCSKNTTKDVSTASTHEQTTTVFTPQQTKALPHTPATSKEIGSRKSEPNIENIHTIIIVSCLFCGVLVIIIILTVTRKMWINFICVELKRLISRDEDFPQVPEGENICLKEHETPVAY